MHCDKAYDRREDPMGRDRVVRLQDHRADSSEIPPEIAVILSSVEDGLSRLRRPDPDLDGGRDLLCVIAAAVGAATERDPWAAERPRGVVDTSVPDLPEIARGGLSLWQRKRAVGMMARLDQDAPTVSELAAACRLSNGYFIKAFKQTFGATPRRWRLLLRVEQAKNLLVSNDLTIAEIALTCGFADQSHLTRVFGQIVGVPPARWRRRSVDITEMATNPAALPAYAASQR
ncbi:AraC family transcriptional regulator [Caulobacter sp. CCH9-E1]|uniref:helix-turn-helix domain-containing protein n=1 Tax=Caulobacter sp. CCH9-E1 TaxID=1768768 RepID=UPI000831A010|nr:AraC family transcriptional regulator [Caulobacter sp. CCH9-E1]